MEMEIEQGITYLVVEELRKLLPTWVVTSEEVEFSLYPSSNETLLRMSDAPKAYFDPKVSYFCTVSLPKITAFRSPMDYQYLNQPHVSITMLRKTPNLSPSLVCKHLRAMIYDPQCHIILANKVLDAIYDFRISGLTLLDR